MFTLSVTEEALQRHMAFLSGVGCLGEPQKDGFLRAGYSHEETTAMRYIESKAIELGLTSRWDGIGNLFLEISSNLTEEFIEVASHIDTVPMGGNFDGAAGVVAGLEAIASILACGQPLRRGLRLRVWRLEESSTFNTLYVGSLGAFGKLNDKYLQHTFHGLTLEKAMREQGYDSQLISSHEPTITQSEVDRIAAHFELHIEQGNVLERLRKPVGIVTSIRGPVRYRIELSGSFDHSGATPMGIEFRRDANLALANILVELDRLAVVEIKNGKDLVQTIGVINSNKDFNETEPEVYQNAIAKVSGYAYFGLDIRSADGTYKQDYLERALLMIKNVAERFGVAVKGTQLAKSDGVSALDAELQNVVEKASQSLGIPSMRLASGAGHDAAIVAAQSKTNGSSVPVSMIFVPCKDGKSHCPEEFATPSDLAAGASVLATAMGELALER